MCSIFFVIIKIRISNERRWFICKIYEITQAKYEIIELLSKKYSVKLLCLMMDESRAGYYKWLKKEIELHFNRDDYKTVEEYINEIIENPNNYRQSYCTLIYLLI